MIRMAVEHAIRDMPCDLINTVTGRLHDKTQQAAAFEQLPIFDELRSSMTTRPDYARIQEEVKKFYRYVMLSDTWQPNEPFQMVEDTAYSLFGVFNVAIPVIYGEGDRAVGRLLEHILTGSGDVTILAWTGRAGSYNSCLPVDLTVYNQIVPPHIPQPIETSEMDNIVAALRSSLPDHSLAVTLHGHLDRLTPPSAAASRLRLPGIVFPITDLVCSSRSDTFVLRVYRATTTALGDVEITTMDNLSGVEDYVLIHPWISPLLDQDFSRRTAGLDDTTRALRLVARLRQLFSALLLKPLSRCGIEGLRRIV